MLWTALRYPALPLERIGPREPGTPYAVAVRDGSRKLVLVCDAVAREAGVRAGLALSSALAIAPGLVVADHDDAAQAAHLELLALAALGHSSIVVPHPPDTVLIESGGSLHLFGGIDAFVSRLRASAAADGLSVVVATAPTPFGARLLARAGLEVSMRTVDGLRRRLAPLPLAPLGLDERTLAGLRRSGVKRVGELLALPPTAVARRFGRELSDALYRLDARLPDPQTPLTVPPSFHEGADLPLEAASTGALAFLLRRLLGALGGFLRGADLGVGELRLTLRHRHGEPTTVRLRLAAPSNDAAHLARTLGARLERTVLAAPVVRLELEAARLAEIERAGSDLLDAAGEGGATPIPAASDAGVGGGIEELIDELAGRLGAARVYTALTRDEHRPESATARAVAGNGAAASPWPARPLWLLREPREAPRSLELASAPERIESGWWDEVDVRRDYFVARDARGVHYWVYRRRGEAGGRLWIHGLFA